MRDLIKSPYIYLYILKISLFFSGAESFVMILFKFQDGFCDFFSFFSLFSRLFRFRDKTKKFCRAVDVVRNAGRDARVGNIEIVLVMMFCFYAFSKM